MTRPQRVRLIVFIVLFVINILICLVECEDKRIIIYVPRRIKTIHHHHHHVVLMDPKTKTFTPTNPHSETSSSLTEESDMQRTRALDHRLQQEQLYEREEQHHQQQESMAAAKHPLSYVERQKTLNADIPVHSVYPVARLPRFRANAAWPTRNKRSRTVTRLYTTSSR